MFKYTKTLMAHAEQIFSLPFKLLPVVLSSRQCAENLVRFRYDTRAVRSDPQEASLSKDSVRLKESRFCSYVKVTN